MLLPPPSFSQKTKKKNAKSKTLSLRLLPQHHRGKHIDKPTADRQPKPVPMAIIKMYSHSSQNGMQAVKAVWYAVR